MKIANSILALGAFYGNAWGTTAFSVQGPRAMNSALKSSINGSGGPPGRGQVSPSFSAASTSGRAADMPVAPSGSKMTNKPPAKNIWDTSSPITVQGGSLRTWSTPDAERVQVLMKTEGRPLSANVDLWQGPDNTPQKMGIYIEDACLRPFSAVIETPRGPNAIAIRNTGQMEFPLSACVEADVGAGLAAVTKELAMNGKPETIQGGALRTYPFAPAVESVQILLKTDGRPLNARIELLQGPNNNKQVIDLYTEDGMDRPFFAVIETPGSGNVVRVVNTATVEFPMTASVQPYRVEAGANDPITEGRRGWDNAGTFRTGQNS